MSVLRQQNWLGQQRVDVTHVRAIESSICADFDVLAGHMLSGQAPLVLQGFDTITTNAVGQPASNLQVNVANATVMHNLATEAGSIFWVPSTRAIETLNASNTRLKGSFTASSTNYVGIDLQRSADSTTADLVQFLNPLTNLETPKDVPLARTLDYVIYVSTQDFSTTPNICPIAIVTTDASNNVATLTDARNMMFRLGSGGSSPNSLFTYAWPGGRTELGTNTDFSAADKKIPSLKDWMNAAMTRLWEVGGGEHWYSNTGWHNVQLLRNGTSVFVSTGDYFEWTGTNLHWKSLRFVFSNSTGWFNDIADQTVDNTGLTDLADGQCIYVDLDRTTNRTGGTALSAIKGTTATLGSPLIPGSRAIIAWRIGTNIFTRGNSYYIGATFNVATTSTVGTVKLHQAATTPATPIVLSDGDLGTANGVISLDGNRSSSFTSITGTAFTATSGAGNGSGIQGNGQGTGQGVGGNGGTSSGNGVFGQGGATAGTGVQGFGGANAGVGSGKGGNFIGGNNSGTSGETGASGAGIQTSGPSSGYGCAIVTKQSATANIAAQYRAQASDGTARFEVDYLGFRGGWVFERDYMYEIPTVNGGVNTTTLGFNSTTTTNARAGVSIGNFEGAGLPWGGIYTVVTSGRTNADSAIITGPSFYQTTGGVTFDPHNWNANQITVLEFVLAIQTPAPANADYFIGLSSASQPWGATGNLVAGLRFKQSSSDTTWGIMTGDGTTQTTTPLSGSPSVAAGVAHRIRFEIHRSGSPYGAGIRVFCDGVLTTKTTNLPISTTIGSPLPIVMGTWSTATDPSNAAGISIAPLRVKVSNTAAVAVGVAGPTTSDV